jgi:hypothetical protein
MGARNFFVPGRGVIYASPSLILHYVLNHGYNPPAAFQEAVLQRPPMWSREYFEAMDAVAGKWWWCGGEPPGPPWDAMESHFNESRVERERLATTGKPQCSSIPLTKTAGGVYAGEVADLGCLERPRWILGIHAKARETEIVTRVPRLVRICSQQFVLRLLRYALPGLTLTHLPVPPLAIPAKIGFHYFSAGTAGPCWDHIVKTRQVGVHIPPELTDPTLELLALADD